MSDSRILAGVAFFCSAAVLAAALLVTLALASGSPETLRWPFRMMCHGQIDRAFEIAGVAMPLCARCCGIYAGIAGAALVLFVTRPRVGGRAILALGTALVLPLVVDGTFQLVGVWSTANVARALTGLAFGIGLIVLAGNSLASGGNGAREVNAEV